MAQPTRTRTRLGRAERREQIVDAAAEVFQGRDPAEVTFEEIADAAGVSRALVYNYFGDRHGLLEAVYLRNVALLHDRVGMALTTAKGRNEALEWAVREHVQFAAEDPSGFRYAAGEVAFARLSEHQSERVHEVAAILGGSEDAALVGNGILAALRSMVLHWLDHPGPSPERATELITAFLAGALKGTYEHGIPITPTWSVRA
jgi:AcrR family transcriptional regulator